MLPEKDIRVLWDGIGEYNFSQTGLKGQPVLVFLRDEQHEVIGGGYGWAVYAWLHVRVLGSEKINVKGDGEPASCRQQKLKL